MITQEQLDKLHAAERYIILAVLTEDYTLLKGTIVRIALYQNSKGDLYINDECVDYCFPYDAAELLE